MKQWCKIIEALDHQVLFWMEPVKNGKVNLHQMINFHDICCDSQIRNIPKQDVEVIFEGIDERTARVIVKSIEDLIESNKRE